MQNSCDKEKGFTLAEVILTLSIVGSIASFTIPAMVQNIQDKILITRWRTAYSIINEANSRALMNYGGDFTSVFANRPDMMNKMKVYFKYLKQCPDGETEGNCWPAVFYDKDGTPSGLSDVNGIILNNGMFLRFYLTTSGGGPTCTETTYYTTGECGMYELDVNGFDGPNRFGKDIYFIHVLKNRMRPAGVSGSAFSSECTSAGGMGCGAYHLRQ